MSRAIYIKSEGNARPLKVTDFEGFTFGELKAHVPEVNFDNSNVIIAKPVSCKGLGLLESGSGFSCATKLITVL